MTLDTARTTADSVADHVADHNLLHARHNLVGGWALSSLPLKDVTVAAIGSDPRPREFFDGYLWGEDGTDIFRSDDGGETWEQYAALPGGSVRGILKTSDGEVLVARSLGVWRSSDWSSGSPTWAQTLDVQDGTTAGLLEWGFDGHGLNFIATHYSATRVDSRYAWITTDGGATWSQVWDSAARFPNDHESTHLHGVCYDRWDDRFFLTEGHVAGVVGIYVSTDDGDNWTIIDDDGLNLTSAPTTVTATDQGIVFGSDNANNGIWVLRRNASKVEHVWRWNLRGGLNGFATQGKRDPTTGIVYVGFRTQLSGAKAIIAASDGQVGSLVWTDTAEDQDVDGLAVTASGVLGAFTNDDRVLYAKVGNRGEPPKLDSGNIEGGVAGDNKSVAVGPTVQAQDRTVNVGGDCEPATEDIDDRMVIVGVDAQGTRIAAVVVGWQASVTHAYAVALGYQAAVSAQGGVALGRGATVTHLGSVAIGEQTATARTNEVHVGNRDVEIGDATRGIILQKPGGGSVRVTVNDSDQLVVTSI